MKSGLSIVILLAVLAITIVSSTARWQECRRVHPGWYCAMDLL